MHATGGGSPRSPPVPVSRHRGPNGRSMLLSSEPQSNRQPSPLIPPRPPRDLRGARAVVTAAEYPGAVRLPLTSPRVLSALFAGLPPGSAPRSAMT